MTFPPVAIIGQGCVLPGASNPDELWRIARDGRSVLAHAPMGLWGVHPGADQNALAKETLHDIGGYVTGFEKVFSPHGFRIPVDPGLDPVFLWTLHAAREAMRDAGRDIERSRFRGAVILGNLSYPTPGLIRFAHDVWRAKEPATAENRFNSGLPAALTAQAIGFDGQRFSLDAACASSLYAIALACRQLADGHADLAVAGGVNHVDDLFLHLGFTTLSALSPSGRSRPFHKEADGLVPAQGVALVVLKLLSAAIRDGDRIQGVIRGVGLSNDGRSRGLLVPSGNGQIRAMMSAYEMSGLSPLDISLVECHATGTMLGDATEIRSLKAVFAGASDVPLGSLKSNLGHLVTASGAAGLLKVVRAMRAQIRPATLHAEKPAPELETPFRLLHETEPWPSEGVRRAAISSFGFGGNNAHMIVEEWRPEHYVWSAPRPPREPEPIAVVAMATHAGNLESTEAFESCLFSLQPRAIPKIESFTLALDGLRFPPADLADTLPQQTLLLRLAATMQEEMESLPAQTSILVGMQCDAEAVRHGLHWRQEDVRAVQPGRRNLNAASTLGCMPNMVANRLSQQFGAEGPGFAVSAEEASGTMALSLAMTALSKGEIEAAVVAAVDLSCEPVQNAAAQLIQPGAGSKPGDAAVMMILKRLADARRDGDPVLAILTAPDDSPAEQRVPDIEVESGSLTWLFGHPHACSGLLHMAAAISACRRRALLPATGRSSMPWIPDVSGRRMRVRAQATGGAVTQCDVEASAGLPERGAQEHGFAVFGADSMDELIEKLGSGCPSGGEGSLLRVAVVTRDPHALIARTEQAMRMLADDPLLAAGALCEGVWFGRGALEGEVACVFGGPAGAYAGMGRELLLAFPSLTDSLCDRAVSFRESAGWLYERDSAIGASPEEKLWGSSFLSQIHAELTLHRLKLRPHASIGYCSGETNALFAFGAWNDLDDFRRELQESGVCTKILSGRFECLRSAWGLSASEAVAFTTLRVAAPAEKIREALANERRVHLIIVHGRNDAVIAGDREGCQRVADHVGATRARSLGYDFVMHCPEARVAADQWRTLHKRRTQTVSGVRFYTHATLSSYTLSDDRVADALVGQAMSPIDFPAMIERAWADGVRVFVEHGPHGACTHWIDDILGDRPHLAVALDQPGRSSLLQALESVARLFAAGVALDPTPLVTARADAAIPKASGHEMRICAHAEPVRLSESPVQIMMSPPDVPITLARLTFEGNGALHEGHSQAATGDSQALALHHQDLAQLHIAFERQLARSHMKFVELLSRLIIDLPPSSEFTTAVQQQPAQLVVKSRGGGKPGPKLDRRALEAIASGPVAPVLGPLFEEQDSFRRVVRMPEPPLLLADRVTGIDGTPCSMGQGTIWTETDVTAGAWYLHEGRMPAGLVVEAGQADLLLISWLGIDRLNRGERVYRLLGCDLTLFGELPRAGDTLAYEISIDGHAQQGDVRLFFFHYDCRVNGELRMKVRGGQAGFFTDQELAETGGVLFDPARGAPTMNGRLDAAPVICRKSSLNAAEIQAFIDGRVYDCFGEGFHLAQSHTRTPGIPGGRLRLVDEILDFHPAGGPWKRGYLRAKLALSPEHWFYRGHFKDDPCMPGTLMLEGSLQAMSIYLAALGFTLERDGFLFMPAADCEYQLRCRGQATPISRELIYEVFVDEVIGGAEPILFADLLGTVDGVKAFHCRRMGLKLTAAYPLDPGRIASPVARSLPTAAGTPFVFDPYSLMACAWGRPSEAFGPMYAVYDSGKVVPRLPGPPFHFMSRILSTEGRMGGGQTGTKVAVEYDIPEDAWYFGDNNLDEMPLCALMEVALQPCGWIASFSGVLSGEEFCFRNLDGDGVIHRSVDRMTRVLSTNVHFTSLSRVGDMIIVGFDVEVKSVAGPVFSCQTRFGYFTRESMRDQAGLPAIQQDDSASMPYRLDAGLIPRATGKLRMIDEVVSLWPDGGAAKLGRIVARREVLQDDWYFRAHFFRDPVQPGSLGIEAMFQALQVLCVGRNHAADLSVSRMEPLGEVERRVVWKYRGQVTPDNRGVAVDVSITSVENTSDGALIRAEGSLYVDSKRIYHASGLSVKVSAVSGEPRVTRLFALTGDTEGGILADRDKMEAQVRAGASLADISCESLTHATAKFALACSVMAHDRATLLQELGWAASGIPKALSIGTPWLTPSGSYFAPLPLGKTGKVAFVYPGMGSASAGAGSKIFNRFTGPINKLKLSAGPSGAQLLDTVFAPDSAPEALVRDATRVSRASMVLSYLYTQLLRDQFGLVPQMATGFSIGEGSMFAALSVWPDPGLLDRKFSDSNVFTERLAGPMVSAKEHFGIPAEEKFSWRAAIVQGPLGQIQEAVGRESKVSLLTIHTPTEAMIGGEAQACKRVLNVLQMPYIDAPFQLAIHCGAAKSEIESLKAIHDLPVNPSPKIAFYSAASDQPLEQTSSAIAAVLAESYTQTVDFPELIGKLYRDGARIFVEVGGQSNCSHWIGKILENLPHACAALHSSVLDEEQALLRGFGVLLSHRLKLEVSAFTAHFVNEPPVASVQPDKQDAPPGGRWQKLILSQVADLLGLNEPSQLPLDSPIPLDSLTYMQLRSHLEASSGCLIEPEILRQNRTVRSLAVALESLTAAGQSAREAFQTSDRYVGSWGQLNMWQLPRTISSRLTPQELHRSVPILWVRSRIELEGPLEVERLREAVVDTFARYDIFRSIIHETPERPEIEVLSGWLPDVSVEERSEAAIERFFGLSIEPGGGMPARVAIFREAADRHEVCLHQHHIFNDGISLSIFWKEVIARYLGAPVPPPGPTFEEYCRSADRWLASEDGRTSRSYWERKLRGVQPTRLPLDYPRTDPADFRGEHVALHVSSDILASIDELCRRESVTRFSVLLWALARTLHLEIEQDDILLSTFHANRALPGLQRAFDIVGPVTEEQVLRCRIETGITPEEQVREMHDLVEEAMAHSAVPVMFLRKSGECPLPATQVSLVYQSFVAAGDLAAGPLKLRLREPIGFGKGHASFELELVLWPESEELKGVAAFSTQVFRRSTVERILDHFYQALAEISYPPATTPTHRVGASSDL